MCQSHEELIDTEAYVGAVGTESALLLAFSPRAEQVQQRQRESEEELAHLQPSPDSTPPLSPLASAEATLRPNLSPMWPLANINKLLNDIATNQASPSQSRYIQICNASRTRRQSIKLQNPPTPLSSTWDSWEPLFLMNQFLGRAQQYPVEKYLDQLFCLLKLVLVHISVLSLV